MTPHTSSRHVAIRSALRSVMASPHALALGTLLTLALVVSPVQAADAPVVRQVETPAPAANPAATQQAEPAAPAVGDITRALLAAQADGRRAGSELGIPGPVASATWKRYLESFTYPIPALFEERLEKSASN